MPMAKRGSKEKKMGNYFSLSIHDNFITDFLLALVSSVCQNLFINNNFIKNNN